MIGNGITPSFIKERLDEFVIGQESLKKIIATVIYLHKKRVSNFSTYKDFNLSNSNMFIVGNSGTGKTLTAMKACEILGIDSMVFDCSLLTPAGYKGSNIDSFMYDLYRKCDSNICRTERSVVILDEFDKLIDKIKVSDKPGNYGFSAMSSFLKILEGIDMSLNDNVVINTRNILFIATGSCEGIEDIIERRLTTNQDYYNEKVIDFNFINGEIVKVDDDYIYRKQNDLISYVEGEDLIEYGFMPEIIGRFTHIASTSNLSYDEIKRIIVEPKNSLFNQYKNILENDGIGLEITEKALNFMAKKAVNSKTGVRNLRSAFEKNMLNVLYEIPDNKYIYKVVIDSDEKDLKSRILEFKNYNNVSIDKDRNNDDESLISKGDIFNSENLKEQSLKKELQNDDNLSEKLKNIKSIKKFIEDLMDVALENSFVKTYHATDLLYSLFNSICIYFSKEMLKEHQTIYFMYESISLKKEDRMKTYLDCAFDDLRGKNNRHPALVAYNKYLYMLKPEDSEIIEIAKSTLVKFAEINNMKIDKNRV